MQQSQFPRNPGGEPAVWFEEKIENKPERAGVGHATPSSSSIGATTANVPGQGQIR
jgi:hypothetical protein